MPKKINETTNNKYRIYYLPADPWNKFNQEFTRNMQPDLYDSAQIPHQSNKAPYIIDNIVVAFETHKLHGIKAECILTVIGTIEFDFVNNANPINSKIRAENLFQVGDYFEICAYDIEAQELRVSYETVQAAPAAPPPMQLNDMKKQGYPIFRGQLTQSSKFQGEDFYVTLRIINYGVLLDNISLSPFSLAQLNNSNKMDNPPPLFILPPSPTQVEIDNCREAMIALLEYQGFGCDLTKTTPQLHHVVRHLNTMLQFYFRFIIGYNYGASMSLRDINAPIEITLHQGLRETCVDCLNTTSDNSVGAFLNQIIQTPWLQMQGTEMMNGFRIDITPNNCRDIFGNIISSRRLDVTAALPAGNNIYTNFNTERARILENRFHNKLNEFQQLQHALRIIDNKFYKTLLNDPPYFIQFSSVSQFQSSEDNNHHHLEVLVKHSVESDNPIEHINRLFEYQQIQQNNSITIQNQFSNEYYQDLRLEKSERFALGIPTPPIIETRIIHTRFFDDFDTGHNSGNNLPGGHPISGPRVAYVLPAYDNNQFSRVEHQNIFHSDRLLPNSNRSLAPHDPINNQLDPAANQEGSLNQVQQPRIFEMACIMTNIQELQSEWQRIYENHGLFQSGTMTISESIPNLPRVEPGDYLMLYNIPYTFQNCKTYFLARVIAKSEYVNGSMASAKITFDRGLDIVINNLLNTIDWDNARGINLNHYIGHI